MDLAHIARMRLARQGLTAPRFGTAPEVVGWLGAVQSQEYDVAKWSLGQRAAGESDTTVEQALARSSILRTHVLRPTWHFVLPADIRWLIGLTAPRIRRFLAYYDRQLELDGPSLVRSQELIETALAEAGHLTRSDLGRVLSAGGIEAGGQRLGHVLMHAELNSLVCSGPRKGKQHTYTLLAKVAPEASPLSPDEALAELARRFFSGHGPATAKDLAVWASLTLTDARRGLEMLGNEVEAFDVDGRTYWLIGDAPSTAEGAPLALLLQGYDEYIMGYNESKDVLGTGGQGWLAPGRPPMTHALMIDGQLAGHWRRLQSLKRLTIELQLRRRVNAGERDAIEKEVQRYGEFVGLPAEIGRVEEPVDS